MKRTVHTKAVAITASWATSLPSFDEEPLLVGEGGGVGGFAHKFCVLNYTKKVANYKYWIYYKSDVILFWARLSHTLSYDYWLIWWRWGPGDLFSVFGFVRLSSIGLYTSSIWYNLQWTSDRLWLEHYLELKFWMKFDLN